MKAYGHADAALIQWLFTNAGPVIRYRTATELAGHGTGRDRNKLARELVESSQVACWLGHLATVRANHGSRNWELENPAGKLIDLGVRAGMTPAFDQAMLRWRRYFSANQGIQTAGGDRLAGAIVASCLVRAGYEDQGLQGFLLERLEEMFAATCERSYAIYDPPGAWPDMPAAYRKRYPVVSQQFAPNGNLRLPFIHDVYALSAFPAATRTPEIEKKIRGVIRYVLTDTYQRFPSAYGYLRGERDDKGRYIVAGWAANLPGWRGFEFGSHAAAYFVQRVELMAHFPEARGTDWFVQAVRHLEGFRTPQGTYRFLRRYLVEKPVGYWVFGSHMGLEDNRRSLRAIELESTFRMLNIKRLMADGPSARGRPK